MYIYIYLVHICGKYICLVQEATNYVYASRSVDESRTMYMSESRTMNGVYIYLCIYIHTYMHMHIYIYISYMYV